MGVIDYLFGKPKPKYEEPTPVGAGPAPQVSPAAAGPAGAPSPATEPARSRRDERRRPEKQPKEPKPDNRLVTKEDFKVLQFEVGQLALAVGQLRDTIEKANDNNVNGILNLQDLVNRVLFPVKETNFTDLSKTFSVTVDPLLAKEIAGSNGKKPVGEIPPPKTKTISDSESVQIQKRKGGSHSPEHLLKMQEGRRRAEAKRKEEKLKDKDAPNRSEVEEIFGDEDNQPVLTES